MPSPDGRVMHAELKLGTSRLMICDEFPEYGPPQSPTSVGRTTVCIHMYVPDCDAVYNKAVAAGAEVVMPVQDMFWGDRYGKLKDPFGH